MVVVVVVVGWGMGEFTWTLRSAAICGTSFGSTQSMVQALSKGLRQVGFGLLAPQV